MEFRWLAFCFSICFPPLSFSAELPEYEKGELAGKLGFGAMTIDAYYEICVSNGFRTDNRLNGIAALLDAKWNLDLMLLFEEERDFSGRNFRQEAHNLVNSVAQRTGGCDTFEMKIWLSEFVELHEGDLLTFHGSP